jgi:flagellar biosynthesis/type III secretory pathway protein FliH
MEYSYDKLKGMTVAELREIAAGIQNEAVQGYTQMNKEHLLAALAKALNLDTHTRHKIHVAGLDKTGIKAHMKELKKKRDDALGAHDHAQLKKVRREMHDLRRSLRRAAAAMPKKQ